MNQRLLATSIVLAATTVAGLVWAKSWSADWDHRVSADKLSGNSSSGTNWYPRWGNYFIWRIEWAEKNDRPCWWRTHSARLVGTKSTIMESGATTISEFDYEYKTDTFDTCTGGPNMGSVKDLWFEKPGVTWIHNGMPRFITRLRVCNSEKSSSDKERVKGLAIDGRTLTEVGTFGPLVGEKSEERPNCVKPWREWSTCPANTAAVGLELQEPGATLGVRLICAPVLPVP